MIDKLMFALVGFIPGFFVGIFFAVAMIASGREDDDDRIER